MLLLLFLCYSLTFFITAVIAQISNPIAEFIIPIGIPTKEAKAEIEIHSVIVERKKEESVKYNLELYRVI